MACCRNSDTGMGSIGNWYPPTGPPVISLYNIGQNNNTFYRVVAAQQVRLGSRGAPTGPLGTYTCSVPNNNGILVNATINIINILSGKYSS